MVRILVCMLLTIILMVVHSFILQMRKSRLTAEMGHEQSHPTSCGRI